jgi:hypothetical protein
MRVAAILLAFGLIALVNIAEAKKDQGPPTADEARDDCKRGKYAAR